MILKDKIFALFGRNDALNDSYKDGNGKGLLQRFNEMLAGDYDDHVDPLVVGIFENVLNPVSCFERYLPFLEEGHGNRQLFITGGTDVRRKIQNYILRLYQIKGTVFGYKHLFKLMGLNVTITEFYNNYSFDSAVTFDDAERHWDMFCLPCSQYCLDISRIDLTTDPLTDEELLAINNIIVFNQPINTKLKCIEFNGTGVDLSDFIDIEFNADYF